MTPTIWLERSISVFIVRTADLYLQSALDPPPPKFDVVS